MRTPIDAPREERILFAHRGASGHARGNTIEAFRLALTLGATGLESDAWLTRDGAVVLDHGGTVRRRLRARTIASTDRADLPHHVPDLPDLLAILGAAHLSLDVGDVAALDPIVAATRAAGVVPSRTWLCHPDPAICASWATRFGDDGPRVVHSGRIGDMPEGIERRIGRLAEAGVAALNMHREDWSGGLVALAHRFGVEAFAWDVRFAHQASALLAMGCDAVYGDWPDRLVDGRDGREGSADATGS